MELYGSGQSCQYIERFTTLLSKGLGLLVATKHRGQRMCDSRGGGWRTGKGFVEAWWETTNGVDGSRPAGPLGRETAMMERELTGQRDGQAWKSHQINDEKFQWRQESLLGMKSHGACKRVTTECTWGG